MNDTLNILLGELIGTMVLIILGNGVCASANFKNMFAKKVGANWLLIAFGWGFAVFCGVAISIQVLKGHAHLNPAVTVYFMINQRGANLGLLFGMIAMQILGAMLAQVILNFLNWKHIVENDAELLKASSCTGPSHRKSWFRNISYEMIGTMILLAGVMAGDYHKLTVVFFVMAIGMSIGSVTGYAINPARDFGPRLVYFLTTKAFGKKMQNIVSADFRYGLVPIFAPIVAGLIMGGFSLLINR
ncbi:aquaporin family protein [Mycoplasma tullyi]|uniref:Aquaporin family protein n=1 Tax=Mycoplasma tullyi TaxID=1612150 RepID=A0A7D7YK66_9MOLU|nr:MIP/aquaporin family protein [Mycoplasma tullyi]QMT98541.1 aquaporin family protein [Mycoplasma tullyi]